MEEEKLMRYQEKWFVLHHKSLYNENPNLIGFREADEWRKIKTGHLVVTAGQDLGQSHRIKLGQVIEQVQLFPSKFRTL